VNTSNPDFYLAPASMAEIPDMTITTLEASPPKWTETVITLSLSNFKKRIIEAEKKRTNAIAMDLECNLIKMKASTQYHMHPDLLQIIKDETDNIKKSIKAKYKTVILDKLHKA
jgi:hypothetical protein